METALKQMHVVVVYRYRIPELSPVPNSIHSASAANEKPKMIIIILFFSDFRLFVFVSIYQSFANEAYKRWEFPSFRWCWMSFTRWWCNERIHVWNVWTAQYLCLLFMSGAQAQAHTSILAHFYLSFSFVNPFFPRLLLLFVAVITVTCLFRCTICKNSGSCPIKKDFKITVIKWIPTKVRAHIHRTNGWWCGRHTTIGKEEKLRANRKNADIEKDGKRNGRVENPRERKYIYRNCLPFDKEDRINDLLLAVTTLGRRLCDHHRCHSHSSYGFYLRIVNCAIVIFADFLLALFCFYLLFSVTTVSQPFHAFAFFAHRIAHFLCPPWWQCAFVFTSIDVEIYLVIGSAILHVSMDSINLLKRKMSHSQFSRLLSSYTLVATNSGNRKRRRNVCELHTIVMIIKTKPMFTCIICLSRWI